jgi:hypothetical protein
MLRIAYLNLLVLACATGLVLNFLTTPALAQDASLPGIQPRAVAGAPFSAVGTMQIIRRTMDGNRFVRTNSTHYYRDGGATSAAECDDGTNGSPPLSAMFDGALITPSDQGWSAPASLGEKSIDGINAVGVRRV